MNIWFLTQKPFLASLPVHLSIQMTETKMATLSPQQLEARSYAIISLGIMCLATLLTYSNRPKAALNPATPWGRGD